MVCILAEVLPNLAECQKILNDQAGNLSSCVLLLSLEDGLFLAEERQAFQLEVVRLAHSKMKHPVPLDVSLLITFSGNPGPPLQLCDGDPGTLSIIKSSDAHILKPGKNVIKLDVPPQKPGGPQDNDDFMSYEKPTRPVLKGSLLSIDTGLGLMIDESHTIDINEYAKIMEDKDHAHDSNTITENNAHPLELKQLYIENGKIELLNWASGTCTTLWFPVHAIDDRMARAVSADSPHRQNMVEGIILHIKLKFNYYPTVFIHLHYHSPMSISPFTHFSTNKELASYTSTITQFFRTTMNGKKGSSIQIDICLLPNATPQSESMKKSYQRS
ncbi:hypothetical protein ZIOFF_073177 [Zingiber officinale]|uniref:Uncharacterized protein n=1 Tax=Zingiber officinale TaxID=94328 RepID=A0A8J5BBM9_ZINOF|nr:hypothetical protein ZIOFF_073177 [Zingiber officinale]